MKGFKLNKSVTIFAMLGWMLFALTLWSPQPAPADEGGGGRGGAGGPCPADINDDNVVDVNDLLAVVGTWGSCPECTTHAHCDDGNPCTTDQCVGGICQHTPIPNCCATSGQCNDGNPCTLDTCQNNVCQHAPIANCCTNSSQCPPAPHAFVGCVGNQCQIVGCQPGWFNCDGEYSNGCEWPSSNCP